MTEMNNRSSLGGKMNIRSSSLIGRVLACHVRRYRFEFGLLRYYFPSMGPPGLDPEGYPAEFDSAGLSVFHFLYIIPFNESKDTRDSL